VIFLAKASLRMASTSFVDDLVLCNFLPVWDTAIVIT